MTSEKLGFATRNADGNQEELSRIRPRLPPSLLPLQDQEDRPQYGSGKQGDDRCQLLALKGKTPDVEPPKQILGRLPRPDVLPRCTVKSKAADETSPVGLFMSASGVKTNAVSQS